MSDDLGNIGEQIKQYTAHQQAELAQDVDKMASGMGMYYTALIKNSVPHELACTLVEQYQRFILAKALGFDYV